MSAEIELWKVEVPDGVFEVELRTLQQWIVDGTVKPGDRVCKGNMRWVEAYHAPALRRIFDGDLPDYLTPPRAAEDVAPPARPSGSSGPLDQNPHPELQPKRAQTIAGFDLSELHDPKIGEEHQKAAPGEAPCHFHPDRAPAHVCRLCHEQFCNECVKIVGTAKVTICPLCGDLCQPIQRLIHAAAAYKARSGGFGFADFRDALTYPFRHLGALIFGAIAYAFLLIGGFRTIVIAWAVLFGCIAHVINHVAVGRMNRSFLPDFSAFDLWDDLIKPALLGLGVTLVTVGPAIVLTIIVIWNIFIAIPPPPVVSAESKTLTTKDFNELVATGDEKKADEITRKIQAMDPNQQTLDQIKKVDQQVPTLQSLKQMAHFPIWSILGLLLATIWAVLYYPMVLTVAGYTESFKSTINPLVGLDTMRRLGGTFVKAFLMYLGVGFVGGIVAIIVGMILAPFDLPLIGNLPANFVNGTVTFYINMVIACIMGLALYKSADSLGIATD